MSFLGVPLINGGLDRGFLMGWFMGIFGVFWGFLKELKRRALNWHKILNF